MAWRDSNTILSVYVLKGHASGSGIKINADNGIGCVFSCGVLFFK
jgi:hypothetical protein